jgi:hypothetical protein
MEMVHPSRESGGTKMSFTNQDLADFNHFATGKLSAGCTESIVELARQWEWERREFDETVAELREGIADMEAGKGRLFSESMAELRQRLGIPDGE